MTYDHQDDDLILDLGVASLETKGTITGIGEAVGRYHWLGLLDD